MTKIKKPNQKGRKLLQWDQSQMNRALEAVKNKEMSQREASNVFGVPRATIQDRLYKRVDEASKMGPAPLMSHEQETKLIDYACNRAALGMGFGKTQFMRYATQYAKKHNIKFKQGAPSDKWWQGIRKRHPSFCTRKAEATSSIRHRCMDKVKVQKYFNALEGELHKIKSPKQCWNMDETGVQLEHNPGKILARKGAKHLQSPTSGNRETITIIACISAAGEACPPHIIPKGKTVKTLESFRTEDITPAQWSVSESGWTKQGIALLWFEKTFIPSIGPERPQILILDGHDSHSFVELIESALQNDIILVELPAHTSHWLQPCDRTVFGPLKNYYNNECQIMMANYPGVIVSRSNFCGIFAKAWKKAMSPSNIMSGFRACGMCKSILL